MNLITYLRESITFTIPLNDRGSVFTPGEDYSLIFTAKISEQDADIDAVIQKQSGAGITHSTTNALVSLVPDDTADLAARKIVYDIRAQHLVSGARKTVARGTLKLVQDITRETEVSIPVITSEPPLPFATTAAAINAAEEKETPANGDRFATTDSEDGYTLKWFSWQTIKTIFFGDATTKANAAQAAAIAAAASDATTKANAAQAAAIAAAESDAASQVSAAVGLIYNTETGTWYRLTLTGTAGNEIINYTPE